MRIYWRLIALIASRPTRDCGLSGARSPLRIKHALFPCALRRRAFELKPIVQSRGAVAPELDLGRREAIAAPVVRPGHAAGSEPPLVDPDGGFEVGARDSASAIAGSPRRRSGSLSAGRRNRRRSRPPSLRRPRRGTGPAVAAISSGKAPPPAADRRVRAPWRSRCWCRRRGRARPPPCTGPCARRAGRPVSTVASVIASGSLISAALASANQSSNRASGSSAWVKSAALKSFKTLTLRGEGRVANIIAASADWPTARARRTCAPRDEGPNGERRNWPLRFSTGGAGRRASNA